MGCGVGDSEVILGNHALNHGLYRLLYFVGPHGLIPNVVWQNSPDLDPETYRLGLSGDESVSTRHLDARGDAHGLRMMPR
jgi:hypothetical protein